MNGRCVENMASHWNERFKGEEYVYGEAPNSFIKEQSYRLKGKKQIAAYAEGEGRNAVYLAKEGHDVTTYDYAENGLKKTRQLAERSHVHVNTVQADLIDETLPVEEYDAAIMVFGHVAKEHQKDMIQKIISSVKPGGIVMLEVYSEDQLRYQTGGPKNRDMLYSPVDMLSWTQGHRVLHFFYGEQERKEGLLHTGTGHVIQVILQK